MCGDSRPRVESSPKGEAALFITSVSCLYAVEISDFPRGPLGADLEHEYMTSSRKQSVERQNLSAESQD